MWLSGVGRTSCEDCRAAYEASVLDLEPPCSTCKPELKNCNAPFVYLYTYCQDQVIMGAMGPVALNALAIKDAMKDLNIDPDEYVEFSSKVRQMAGWIFAEQRKEAEQKAKAKRN